jgi:hypothetical protein
VGEGAVRAATGVAAVHNTGPIWTAAARAAALTPIAENGDHPVGIVIGQRAIAGERVDHASSVVGVITLH